MNRRAFLASASLVGIGGLAGCTGLLGGDDGEYDVGMSANAFLPEELTVTVGTTVVWKNTGSRAHTVTAYDGGQPDGAAFFATGDFEDQQSAVDGWYDGVEGAIYSGETFEHTFEIPGTHHYYCIPHEAGGMIGRIIVEDEP